MLEKNAKCTNKSILNQPNQQAEQIAIKKVDKNINDKKSSELI